MYQLKWNNHRWNLTHVFEQLLQLGAFTDVTVSCEDGSLKCHKMVLAACSPYFEKILSDESVSSYGFHPIVVLQDTPCDVFRALLEFMYKGEVNIYQEELPLLMSIAASLQIKGLYEDGDRITSQPGAQTPVRQESQSRRQSGCRSPSSPGSEAVDLSRSNSSGERSFPVTLSTSVVVHCKKEPSSDSPSNRTRPSPSSSPTANSHSSSTTLQKRNSFVPFFHSTPQSQSQLIPVEENASSAHSLVPRLNAAGLPHNISVSAQNTTTPILRYERARHHVIQSNALQLGHFAKIFTFCRRVPRVLWKVKRY